MMIAIFIIEVIILIIASILDIQGKDIPIKLSVFSLIMHTLLFYITNNGTIFLHNLFFAAMIFGMFLIGNLFFNLGGADTLMAATATIGIGSWGLIMALIAFLTSIPYAIYREKIKKPQYPFIPFILIGYLICIFIYFFC